MSEAAVTEVTFLGTGSAVPDGGHDTASFVINRKYLVDTGWCATLRMLQFGIDPLQLEYLFFTHLHHDHYMGLPGLLFYTAMRGTEGHRPLKVVGPAEDLERVVGLAREFLQPERFDRLRVPLELIPLKAGDTLEDPAFRIATCASVHPVPALCYRFTDLETGQALAFTGDTAFDAGVVRNVHGAALLITEASFGANPAPQPNSSLHSGAPEAARMAKEAEVGRLALVHCALAKQEEALRAARAIFPNTFWPKDGESVRVG